MLDNNSNLIVGGNNLPSFFASILQPDLINRFLVNSKLASGLLDNKGGIWRAFVTLSISLPFQNLLTKFRNKVHMLLYVLISETITSQRPVIRTVMSKAVAAKNKRERRKAQDGVRIESYSFNASLYNPEHLQFLLYVFSYFTVPNTNKKKTAPSRFVPITLETTRQVIKFSVKSLGNLPFGFAADDLSALRTTLEVQIIPFSTGIHNNNSKHDMFSRLGPLKFLAFGLGVTDVTTPVVSDLVMNLRLKNFAV